MGGYTTTQGIHSLAVQNLSGCAPNITDNIIITAQPVTPSLSAVFTTITCFGGTSLITANAVGGVLPYEYRLNSGTFQSSNVFSVGAGSYTISVKDSNGCIGNGSELLVTQPTAITATASASPIACNGGTSTLTVLAAGGIGAYEYSLSNDVYQSANTFNVVAGTYTPKVRLINNPSCSTSVNTIFSVAQPVIFKATAVAKPIDFCGGTTLVNVAVTGGTPPYTGTGNFVKGPGNWTFVTVDSNGCSTSVDLLIFPPGCVDLKVFPNPSQNFITVNHSAAVGNSSFFQIFSGKGVKVLTRYIPLGSFTTTLNITNIPSGNYVLVYINGDEQRETKFIKMNR